MCVVDGEPVYQHLVILPTAAQIEIESKFRKLRVFIAFLLQALKSSAVGLG